MEVSVIIPTHNRAKLLERTLQGFCQQNSSEIDWELIIVSDGSTESTDEVVMGFKDRLPLRYFSQPKSGVSIARNLGLDKARGRIVLFVDDDVIPTPELINEHLRFHRTKSETESVLLGYVTWLPELEITPFMQWYGEFGGLFGFSLLKDDRENDPRYLYSCNLSLKAEFLRANGGFDPTLSVLEDHELGFRLKQHGMKMYFRRAALGYHNQKFTFDQACQRLKRYRDGLEAFCMTDAGRAMLERRSRLAFRLAGLAIRVLAPALFPLRPLVDSEIRLPNAIYRLFYWYYGSYKAFWACNSPQFRASKPARNSHSF